MFEFFLKYIFYGIQGQKLVCVPLMGKYDPLGKAFEVHNLFRLWSLDIHREHGIEIKEQDASKAKQFNTRNISNTHGNNRHTPRQNR